jgi:hypothetical protein
VKLPSGFSTSRPWAGPLTTTVESGSFSMSESLPSTLPVIAVSSSPEAESPTATGASFTGVTFTVTVVTALVSSPSLSW